MIDGSRYSDPTQVRCQRCGWRGTVRDCVHGWRFLPSTGDVEGEDYCPCCGSVDVWIDWETLKTELQEISSLMGD